MDQPCAKIKDKAHTLEEYVPPVLLEIHRHQCINVNNNDIKADIYHRCQ